MTRVAIIGGGIGGLAAARALTQQGLEVSVYESTPELREIGAGVALGANAMKVLRGLGLEDEVRAVAGHYEWSALRNWKTARVISRTSQEANLTNFGAASATVHRADLLEVLANSLPEDTVTLGARCVEVSSGRDCATARFEDGQQIEADVIVGADGIHSATRASLFGPDAPRFTGKVCYRCVVPVEAVKDGPPVAENAQWLGPHGTIVLYPLRQNRLINIVCHYDDEAYRHESWVERCQQSEVLERYSGWHDSLLGLFSSGELWYKWALYDRDPIPAWTQGRVTLLGDAAHPMLPYLGQGACQTIEDAYVLAAAISAEPDRPAAALDLYERSRRPRASRVVLTARERGGDNHLVSPLAAWRRDLAIALRKRLGRRDPEGRGTAWIPQYDATTPEALVSTTDG